jgi:hypothetical protein
MSNPSDFSIEHNGDVVTPAELIQRLADAYGTNDDDSNTLVLPARETAVSWLAVCLAVSEDDARPALHRRVLVDVHSYGIALAATDSYWMCRSFVPFDGEHASWSPPTLDEIPEESFTIADTEYRIRDLMRYVERITRPKKGEADTFRSGFPLVITRTTEFDPDIPTLDPSLSAPQVVVEIPDTERIIARESEVGYPSLASLARFQPASAKRLLFNPRLISRAAAAVARVGSSAMKLEPMQSGAVAFTASNTDRHLHGVLMPLRDPDDEIPS